MVRTVVLSVVCVGGLGLAVWMIAAWDHKPSDRQPLLVVSDESLEVAERTVRAAVVGIVVEIIAGVLVAGLGGRLMMRVLAATSGDSAQGLVTEAHETVGEITLGGSLGSSSSTESSSGRSAVSGTCSCGAGYLLARGSADWSTASHYWV